MNPSDQSSSPSIQTVIDQTSCSNRSNNQTITQADDHNISIIQSNDQLVKTNELLRYDFIIPLLLVYFTDHDVLTRLLITCKSIKQFMFHYRVQTVLSMDKALSMTERCYWPAMITKVKYVAPSKIHQLACFPSLVSVALEIRRNDSFDMSLVPVSVTHMSCEVYGKLIPNPLPPHLKSLTLCGNSLSIPPGFLPNGLTELDIRAYVVNDVDDSILPATLLSLTLGRFQSALILPDSLLRLNVHATWSPDSFPKGLPPNLEVFEMCSDDHFWTDFPQMTSISFPNSFTRLQLHQQAAPGLIPNTVTHLTYHVQHEDERWDLESGVIPDSVTHLDLVIPDCKVYGTSQCVLPDLITYLAVTIYTDGDYAMEVGYIPPSVTHLIWGRDSRSYCGMSITTMRVPVLVAPCTCGHMCQCPRVQVTYISSISASVTHLTFGDMFDQELQPGDIPRSVAHLVFGRDFNQELVAGAIPDSVTHLSFVDLFNQPLTSDSIPASVQYLQFGKKFNQSLPADVLPSSLKRLTFARQHSPPIDVSHVAVDVAYLTNY